MARAKKTHYLTSEQIREELEVCHIKGQITNKMVQMFTLMVDKIQSSFTYVNDEDRKDVRSYAIEKILTKWKAADLQRPNLFSFFTEVIKNDLYQGWNNLQKGSADFSYDAIFAEAV